MTLAETAYTWLAMARSGEILNRSGKQYKPSVLRTMEGDYRLRLIPELGMHFMSDIERPDLQARVTVWQSKHSASKVHAGWDQYEGEIDIKTEKGRRTTVVIDLLEDLLISHLERTGRSGRDLVFGKTASEPFCPGTIHNKAKRAWKEARQLEDEADTIPEGERIRPIGLHDSRHTAVSHMLDAGITIDKVSKFMGHASITVTIDRYGHLLPGGEAEAAEILNEYHARRQRR